MRILIPIILFSIVLSGCVYPFEPQGVAEAGNILVIEGDIIANGITTIKLSRSVSLSSQNVFPPETKATVKIESNTGNTIIAIESPAGTYTAATGQLDPSLQYRLSVTTSNSILYTSDFVPVKISPPIDSVSYVVNDADQTLDIHVSTHDPANNTHYYKWSYQEDWEFTSYYYATHRYNDKTNQYDEIPYEANVYFCWNKQESKSILVDNSLKLSEDVIAQRKINVIPAIDERISRLYCIQVKQKALTEDAYNYWENLYKNSEDMGGLFSPQPSEYVGNIHCVSNPEEPVLGYISASTESISKHVFIERVFKASPVFFCYMTGISPFSISEARIMLARGEQCFSVDLLSEEPLAQWANIHCIDCTLRGTKNKPVWWPSDKQ